MLTSRRGLATAPSAPSVVIPAVAPSVKAVISPETGSSGSTPPPPPPKGRRFAKTFGRVTLATVVGSLAFVGYHSYDRRYVQPPPGTATSRSGVEWGVLLRVGE